MPLTDFHPAVAAWFSKRFGAATVPQARAWPEIRAGRHTLIAAPTGSGKTLAAFLSAIDDLVRQALLNGGPGGLPDETEVVYVSPLKALSNDVEKNLRKLCLLVPILLMAMEAQALTPVKVLKTRSQGPQPTDSEIAKTVHAHIDTEKYREVRVQLIRDSQGRPSHYLVYLFSKTSHRVDFAKIALDQHFKVTSVQKSYKLQDIDLKQQPGMVPNNAMTSDDSH